MTADKKGNVQNIMKYGALAVWAVLILLLILNRDKITVDAIIHYTPSNLILAAIVLLLLFALKTLSVVFSSVVLYTVSGLLFSLPVAMLVNSLGLIVMISEGYLMGRSFGSDLIGTVSEKYPKINPILHLEDRKPFLFTFLLRFMKIIIFDVGSMYLGASRIAFVPYAAASFLSALPEIIIYAVVGGSISSLSLTAAIGAAVAYGAITVISFLVIAYLVRHPEKLRDES